MYFINELSMHTTKNQNHAVATSLKVQRSIPFQTSIGCCVSTAINIIITIVMWRYIDSVSPIFLPVVQVSAYHAQYMF